LTVRDKSGRKRYIAVILTPLPQGRTEAIRAIEACMENALYMKAQVRFIYMQDGVAIVRCSHTFVNDVVRALNHDRGTHSMRTVGTSGTIKALRAML
jgi:RNase P/RNase MRP subunit POP5